MGSDSSELLWFRKVSEHGLGHLLSPLGPRDRAKRWQEDGWLWILGRAGEPEWFDQPAISRISVSSPQVLGAFAGYNASRPSQEHIRPFNFCLSAHVAPFGHPEGVDPLKFHLIAPYSDDPERYLTLDWFDRFTGVLYRVTTVDDAGRSGAVLLQSYGDVFHRYARHPEAKSLDREGRAGRGHGLLERRCVHEGLRTYVGKESNRIEEVEMGLWHRLEDAMIAYGQAHDPWGSWILPVLREIPVPELIEGSGLDRRTIQRLRSGQARPHRGNELALTRLAGQWARQQLLAAGSAAPRDDHLACRAYRDHGS